MHTKFVFKFSLELTGHCHRVPSRSYAPFNSKPCEQATQYEKNKHRNTTALRSCAHHGWGEKVLVMPFIPLQLTSATQARFRRKTPATRSRGFTRSYCSRVCSSCGWVRNLAVGLAVAKSRRRCRSSIYPRDNEVVVCVFRQVSPTNHV